MTGEPPTRVWSLEYKIWPHRPMSIDRTGPGAWRKPGVSPDRVIEDRGEILAQLLEGNAMSEFDSYREVLGDHARGHHFVWSAWLVVLAIAVLVIVLALV